jgi:hypothetical protein
MGLNYLGSQFAAPGQFNVNMPVDLADKRWMKPGDIAELRKASLLGNQNQFNFIQSTGAIGNATYARLQNLSISYRLPGKLLQRAHMSAMSIHVAGQNLYTISNYNGLDPESTLGGMPALRGYTIGLNLTF